MDNAQAIKLGKVIAEQAPIIEKALEEIVTAIVEDCGTPAQKVAYFAAVTILGGLMTTIVDNKFAGEEKNEVTKEQKQ